MVSPLALPSEGRIKRLNRINSRPRGIAGEDFWESLESKENKAGNPEGNQPWILLEGLMLKLELNTWCEELTLWKTPCCWKRLKAGWEGETEGTIDSTDMNLSKLWEMVKDREAWCVAVQGVTKYWTQLSVVVINAIVWGFWNNLGVVLKGESPGWGRWPGQKQQPTWELEVGLWLSQDHSTLCPTLSYRDSRGWERRGRGQGAIWKEIGVDTRPEVAGTSWNTRTAPGLPLEKTALAELWVPRAAPRNPRLTPLWSSKRLLYSHHCSNPSTTGLSLDLVLWLSRQPPSLSLPLLPPTSADLLVPWSGFQTLSLHPSPCQPLLSDPEWFSENRNLSTLTVSPPLLDQVWTA